MNEKPTYQELEQKIKVLEEASARTEQLQTALRESEENYRQLLENSPAAIYRVDFRTGRFVKANDVFCRYLEYSHEELTALSPYDILTEESRTLLLDRLGKMARGEKVPEIVEYEIINRSGRRWWVLLHNRNICDAQGRVVASDVIAHDITERKRTEDAVRRSEERYRTIFESTATANMIIAEDTTILMINNDFADLSGYTKEELEGKISWTVFVHADDLERMKGYHKMRRIDPASAPPSYEFRFINRKGEVRHLFLSTSMIPRTSESIVSLVDLTERRQLETQLVQAQKMESVGRLAGGVAHDFNNMLSVIIGNTEMALLRVDPTEPLHKPLQDILNAGMRSADLTRQLLAFARKQTISPMVLDLNDTVTGMLKMLQRLIGENINLVWMPGPKLWRVRIDPSQVDQLLANLTVNARDAVNRAGRIMIETSNAVCDEIFCSSHPDCIPGEYVSLAVSDNGCGMDRETLANIFEPFFTTKKEGQGTGLGLATVYGIVKQNSGFISVYSEPGQGTTFRIYLPRHTAESPEAADDQAKTEIRRGTETVLIVEDEEAVLNLSKGMLEMLGYKVLAARGADQALRLAGEYGGKIDLLMTDVVMPEMNGKELAERIIAVKPGIKCLYMSGYTADVIARQGILEKGIQFISKPFSLKNLADKIREAIG